MRIIEKTYILLFLLFATISACSADVVSSVQSEVTANLFTVLEIDSVKVDVVDYAIDTNFNNVIIENVDRQYRTHNIVNLTPMSVKVHTNLGTPIYINADFVSFQSTDGTVNFNPSDLYFSPRQIVANTPYDGIEIGNFIPQVITRSSSIAGDYIGKVLFTLGAI